MTEAAAADKLQHCRALSIPTLLVYSSTVGVGFRSPVVPFMIVCLIILCKISFSNPIPKKLVSPTSSCLFSDQNCLFPVRNQSKSDFAEGLVANAFETKTQFAQRLVIIQAQVIRIIENIFTMHFKFVRPGVG